MLKMRTWQFWGKRLPIKSYRRGMTLRLENQLQKLLPNRWCWDKKLTLSVTCVCFNICNHSSSRTSKPNIESLSTLAVQRCKQLTLVLRPRWNTGQTSFVIAERTVCILHQKKKSSVLEKCSTLLTSQRWLAMMAGWNLCVQWMPVARRLWALLGFPGKSGEPLCERGGMSLLQSDLASDINLKTGLKSAYGGK